MPVVSVVFCFFFSHLVFIQPWICTVIESNTRTKMKEERKEGRKKKKSAVTCVTSKEVLNFCTIFGATQTQLQAGHYHIAFAVQSQHPPSFSLSGSFF